MAIEGAIMLVLSRRKGETIHLGNGIVIHLTKISGQRVTVGIEAPSDLRIVRGELIDSVNEPHASEPCGAVSS